MLLKANWKEGRFKGESVPRGSFVSSYQKLSSETGISLKGVRTALEHLKATGEVAVIRHSKYSVFTIKNYGSYQSEGTADGRQAAGSRQASGRQVATIEEGKKERRKEKNIYASNEASEKPGKEDVFTTIRELYNSVCGSYPRLVKMSEARKKAIRARLNTGYTVEDFRRLFEKAERSEFLKGGNARSWSATFDWLVTDANMAKVLDGNYDSRKGGGGHEPEPGSSVRLW